MAGQNHLLTSSMGNRRFAGPPWPLGLVLLFLFLGPLSCSTSTADVGKALSIELSVDRTSGVAGVDVFTFRYEASGQDLLGVVLEFGDGQADSLATLGSTTAGATRPHTYVDPGSYSAIARVLEAFGQLLADTVMVRVQTP